jgi:hypothetical protein
MAILDADMVATRSLAPLLELARQGKLVAFRDPEDRFFSQWGELLDLGPIERRPYLGSGAIVAPRALATEVLGLMEASRDVVDFEQTYWGRDTPGYPFRYADQDLFNAVAAARVPADRVAALEARLAPTPPFAGLRVADAGALRVSYGDGTAPFLVHHHVAKPWLEPTHHGVYSQLLRRLLVGDDVAIRPPSAWLPLRFRTGLRAFAARKRVNAAQRLRWHVREPLSARKARR